MSGNAAVAVALLLLVGCTTEATQEDNSGQLTCVGYCELTVENKQQAVKSTAPDGTVSEESKKSTGVTRQ